MTILMCCKKSHLCRINGIDDIHNLFWDDATWIYVKIQSFPLQHYPNGYFHRTESHFIRDFSCKIKRIFRC